MKNRYIAALLVLACAGLAWGAETEVKLQTASVTTTSQTLTFSSVRTAVALCSQGTDLTYYRLWTDSSIPTVATSADIPLPAGTAAAPYCTAYTFDKTLSGTGYLHVTIIADSGTATVDITSQ